MEKKNFKTKYNKIPVTKEPEEAVDIKDTVEVKTKPEISWGLARVTNCQNLNLRKNPSSDGAVIKTIKVGTEVQVDKSFKNDTWTKIKYFGDNGYVMSRYLER